MIAEGQARADAAQAEQVPAKPPKPKPEVPVRPEDVPISRREVDKQLDEMAGEIQSLRKERMVVLNKDGTVHLSVDGEKDHVNMTQAQVNGIKDRITIHNHPGVGKSFTSFSNEDIIGGIQRGELESHVVSSGGHRFKISYPDSVRNMNKVQKERLGKKIFVDYNEEMRIQSKAIVKDVKAGKISFDDATLKVSDGSWKVVARKYNLDYTGL